MPMPHNLLKAVKVTRISTAVVATTSTINMTPVDMLGFDGVSFVALTSGSPGTTDSYFKAQSGTSSGYADMADLSSSAAYLTTGISGGETIIEIYRPPYRYVRMVGISGTSNIGVDGAVALQYRASAVAVTHSTAQLYNAVYLNHPSTGGAT